VCSRSDPALRRRRTFRSATRAPGAGTLILDSTLRLRHDADVMPRRLPALRVLLLGFLVADRAGDDDVLTMLPIHRRRHLVLGGELQGVDHPQDLVEVGM